MSTIPSGYKQTEVGVIPEDWEVKRIGDLATVGSGGTPSRENAAYWNGAIPWVTTSQIDFNTITEADQFITEAGLKNSAAKLLPAGTLLMALYGQGKTRGKVGVLGFEAATNQACASIFPTSDVSREFLLYFLATRYEAIRNSSNTGSQENLNGQIVKDTPVVVPPLPEQRAIAAALSDVDALLAKLDQLIAKKRDLKQATMQQLLTGQTRLPGFSGAWEVKQLGDVADCLDNLRVPLNETQRGKMRGDYPYCGANGVLDYVSGYVVDDDIILIAEDGGYFDEYAFRPIAYRMVGKCWVNNHAHILKAKEEYDQGFLFFSLVHKNILNFLASGTRAKLNKSEMWKIEILTPLDRSEQTAIATVLSDMDAELAALEARRDKTRALKQGMMQELLTGRIRLN